MGKYIAVTIGPIFDTIALASSPSALWAASYLFSMLSKNICLTLTNYGIDKSDIITPYFDPDDELLNKTDGVGLFHDRIIFKSDGFPVERFKEIKKEAIKKTLDFFEFKRDDAEYFKKYFLISACEDEFKNPISESTKVLDCLELSKPFTEEHGKNPLLTLYSSDDITHRNQQIVTLVENMNIKEWQLFDSNRNVKSLEHIAKNLIPDEKAKEYKKFKYYAVVRSDGDHMGNIIKTLDTDQSIRDFSHDCLKYCSKIAEEVKSYSGVTIYSGGDDLLALIPVENAEAETVFDFIKSANRIFNQAFKSYNVDVSLSFGVFVAYYKFPLYEALEESAKLLFETAKTYRNCTAIHFQKHSGQSEGLVILNDSLDCFIKLHRELIRNETVNNIEFLISVIYTLTKIEHMFSNVETQKEIQNLFDNTFDADKHKGNGFIRTILPAFYYNLTKILHIYPIANQNLVQDDRTNRNTKRYILDNHENPVLAMNYILRIIKFYTERSSDEEL